MSTSIRCALVLLAVAATPRAGVVVVDPAGGPGGAALLQAAIDAAQDGDILLLKPGDYASAAGSHPQIVDKGLVLVVDGPPGSVVLSGLRVSSTVADTLVVVRGLHVAPPPLAAFPAGAVEAYSVGLLWFEECVCTGALATNQSSAPGFGSTVITPPTPFAGPITLVRCTITGADGADEVPGLSPARPGAAGAAFFAAGSTVQECSFRGGRGGDGDPYVAGQSFPADGGPGLSLVLFAPCSILGGTLRGGDEGLNNPAETKPGPGLRLLLSTAEMRDVTIVAGSVNGAGTPESDILALSSALIDYPAARRSLSVPSPLREGEVSTLRFAGEAGDQAWVVLGLDAGYLPMEFKQANLVLGDVLPSPVLLGSLTGSDTLDVPFHMPDLPAGTDGLLVLLQSAVVPPSGGFLLGSASALVWIDDTF